MTRPENVPETTPAGAADLAATGALLLDVREPGEWQVGHIEGAVLQPLGGLDPMAMDRDRLVITVCRSGGRAGKAAAALADAGVDVRTMAGGMQAWAAAGLPVVDDSGNPGGVA